MNTLTTKESGHAPRSAWLAIRAMLGDARFWIVLFFLIRLLGITSPPAEVGHAWRQCLTNMIARNMVEVDANPLYPRVDTGGDGTGIMGTEFPLLNMIIALSSWFFGSAHWYGRLVVLLVSSVGMIYFHRLCRILFDRRIAFCATLILLPSVWFEFSRKIMPDTFSVSFVIIALYHATRFLRCGGWTSLLWYGLLLCAGGLSKMPALCLGAALIVPVIIDRQWTSRSASLVFVSVIVLAIVGAWYFYWVPYLVDAYHNQLYFPRDIPRGLHELWARSGLTAEMFYFHAFRSFLGFGAFLFGLFILFKHQPRSWRYGFLAIAVVFTFFMIKAGDVFCTHGYYMIPFVPAMAVVAAMAISRLPGRWSMALLGVICFEGVGNQYYDLFIPAKQHYLYELEPLADRFTKRGDLVIVNGGLDPEFMYFLHRKGWSLSEEQCDNTATRDSLVQHGATCLIKIGKPPANPGSLPVLYADERVLMLDLR